MSTPHHDGPLVRGKQKRDPGGRGGQGWFLNFDEYIGDFVKYLVSSGVRKAVKRRLEIALEPLLASGHPVVLVSHSWGTVVAYDVLRSLSRGRLAHYFTLGSPLWMGPVRRKLGFDGQRHAVSSWINVDAKSDLIGGKLHGSYKVTRRPVDLVHLRSVA